MPTPPADPFARAVALVLEDEGRLNNDPVNDPNGGLTNFGISQTQHPKVDVAKLTRDGAIAIYRTEYWAATCCDRLPWPLSFLVFDGAVNQGVKATIRSLQRALGVPVDGVLGTATLAAVARRDPMELTARFTAIRLRAYVIAPEWPQDGEGWFYRVAKNLLAIGT